MPFYLPIIRGPYGVNSTDKADVWMREMPLASLTREEVVSDIERGQIEDVVRVLEIDEAAGTVRDVTKEIAIEVGDLTFGNLTPPFDDLRDWLDTHKAGYFQFVEAAQ